MKTTPRYNPGPGADDSCVAIHCVVLQQGLNPLHLAASHGHVDCVRALLSAGADMNKRASAKRPFDGATPVYIAARNAHEACIEVLAQHGADLNKAKTVRVSELA